MSEQDFEIYLSLLGKLLGLQSDQREEISEELRDHLEHRLHDLLAAGHTKQEAVELALEEFGDAAGLANQFVSITRQQRKRWIMRFATFSIAGCFLMALFVFSFWPEGGKVQVLSTSIGQSEDNPFGTAEPQEDDPFGAGGDSAGDPFGSAAQPQQRKQKTGKQKASKATVAVKESPSEEDKTRASEAKLNQIIELDLIDLPLGDAMAFISERVDVEFYLKKSQLDEIGISTDEIVPDLTSRSIRASMALDLLLHQMDLDYVVRDGIVIVTSAEDVELTHEIRVYDCTDLTNSQVNRIHKQGKRRGGGEDEMAMMAAMEGEGGGMSGMMGDMMEGGMGGMMGGGLIASPQRQAQDLVGLISATVRPESWEQMGGNGSISQFQGLIVINNNARAHRDTEKLLEKIRTAKKLSAKLGQDPFK